MRYPTRRAPLPVHRARQLLLIEASIHSLRHSSLTCFQISPRATPQLSSPTPHAESHRTASVASKAKLSCRSEPTRLARLDSEEIPELPEYLRDLIHKPAEQQPSYELIEQTPSMSRRLRQLCSKQSSVSLLWCPGQPQLRSTSTSRHCSDSTRPACWHAWRN